MTAALILAAGAAPEGYKRKPTDEIGGASSIRRLIMIFRQAGIKKIVVVTGCDAESTEKHCTHMGVVFLRNEDYLTGDMLSSVKIGLDYLRDKCGRVFIVPADVSLFSYKTVKMMDETHEPVVIPICYNKTGHPLLLSKSLFDKVLEYDGTAGIGGALSGADIERRFLDVHDEGILIDTQTNTDVETVADTHELRKIRPTIKLQLSCEKGFFGPGALLLLRLTQETGSLKQAAKRMGLSYSKAINMIENIDEQLGYKVLTSQQGGSGGGRSAVTEKALDLINRYEAFESECTELISDVFDRHFESLL